MDRLKFIKEFRKEFKKKFFFDVTGLFNLVALMVVCLFFLPLMSIYFGVNVYYFFIMLQTANMVFTYWVWNEIRNKGKSG